MALRKTYHNLTVKDGQLLNFTTSTLMTNFKTKYYHNVTPYDRSIEAIVSNTKLDNGGYYSRNGIDLNAFYPDVLLLSMISTENYKVNPDSTIEICPRFDNYTPGTHELTIMIRYYDFKSLEVFESLLKTYFNIQWEENVG